MQFSPFLQIFRLKSIALEREVGVSTLTSRVPSLNVCRLQTSCAALSSCDLLCCTALDMRHGEGGTAGDTGGGKGCALVITRGVANEEWKEESSQIPLKESR